ARTRCAPARHRRRAGCAVPCRHRGRPTASPVRYRAVRAAPPRCRAGSRPAARSCRLLAVAAGQLGDDPARGEGHAERGQRALADQVGGAVDQVAALVHQRVHLLAAGGAGLFQRGDAGERAVGELGLDLGLAQTQLLAGGAGGALGCLPCLAGGLLDVAAGLAKVGLDAVGRGRAHACSPVVKPGSLVPSMLHGAAARPCQRMIRLPLVLPRTTRSTSWRGGVEKPSRKPARSSKRPLLAATMRSPGRSPLPAARLPAATSSTTTPDRPDWRAPAGSSEKVAPARRGSRLAPGSERGCSRRVALSCKGSPSRRRSSVTRAPTACRPSKLRSAAPSSMRWPLAARITSPASTPAAAAAESG